MLQLKHTIMIAGAALLAIGLFYLCNKCKENERLKIDSELVKIIRENKELKNAIAQ